MGGRWFLWKTHTKSSPSGKSLDHKESLVCCLSAMGLDLGEGYHPILLYMNRDGDVFRTFGVPETNYLLTFHCVEDKSLDYRETDTRGLPVTSPSEGPRSNWGMSDFELTEYVVYPSLRGTRTIPYGILFKWFACSLIESRSALPHTPDVTLLDKVSKVILDSG